MRRTVWILPTILACVVAAGSAQACVADTECADATVCNGIETCVAGVCQPGTAPNCNDGTPCTTDSCDPVTGCQHAPVPNNTSCSDGNVCNGPETCQSGVCTPGIPPNCVDANPCTADSCSTLLNHCVYTPVSNGTPCADANVCNGAETCQGGLCAPGTALDCNDGDDCTVDTCNAVL